MLNRERRQRILQKLKSAHVSVTGRELAELCQVSRQIIVSDIAMLRAEGTNILATSQGYLLEGEQKDGDRELPLVARDAESLQRELELIIDNGGSVSGVSVDYGLYGRLTSRVHLASRRDIRKWGEKLRELNLKPLALLAGGKHSLYVKAENEEAGEEIWQVLSDEGFLMEES